MKRYEKNPILSPIGQNAWESRRVFNAAVVELGGYIHLVYRAMGDEGISRLGYARSTDGYNIDERLPNPIFEPAMKEEISGCEDPRLTVFNNELLLTYTAYAESDHQHVYQIGLSTIKNEDFVAKRWNWGERMLPFRGIRNKDAFVFPRKIKNRYVMFHRLEPDICIAYSNNLRSWCDLSSVLGTRPKMWDCWKVGAAGTPIELNEGWLCIYHGVSFEKIYSLGVLILDKENPEEVLYRSKDSILTPETDYERFGKVPNVVFSCGNVLRDDELLIYYGGADSVIAVASYDLNELMPKK